MLIQDAETALKESKSKVRCYLHTLLAIDSLILFLVLTNVIMIFKNKFFYLQNLSYLIVTSVINIIGICGAFECYKAIKGEECQTIKLKKSLMLPYFSTVIMSIAYFSDSCLLFYLAFVSQKKEVKDQRMYGAWGDLLFSIPYIGLVVAKGYIDKEVTKMQEVKRAGGLRSGTGITGDGMDGDEKEVIVEDVTV